MSLAISVDRVTKAYRLGAISGSTLQGDFARWWAAKRGRPDPNAKYGSPKASAAGQDFLALNGVSFDVQEGDVVGLIGRNGAGKSTLLKILSRVTTPTSGKITIYGRVASLLEVGTGFHGDLTGRENVFLNGAILGMTNAEMRRKFDAIVAFSECEQFIDTPVKRYSSGMYVRLAFAVAAHLEPDILIVDEVLAVGDAQFQKKCLGKMQEVGQQGRTVIFVSHTMSAISRLCRRVVMLQNGAVLHDGPAPEVVSAYLKSGLGTSSRRRWDSLDEAPGNDVAALLGVSIEGGAAADLQVMDIRESVRIRIEYQVRRAGSVIVPNIHVYNDEGVCVFIALDSDSAWHREPRHVGTYVSTASIPGNFLAEGTFLVGVALSTLVPTIVHAFAPEAVAFEVVDGAVGDSARGDYVGQMPGVTRPKLTWETALIDQPQLALDA